MTLKIGLFISDLHMPYNISLIPLLRYIKDIKPAVIILGGDVIDAEGLHACESIKAETVKIEWLYRDIGYARTLIEAIYANSPKTAVIYLEGNHEQRYRRLQVKYPDLFQETLNFQGVLTKALPKVKYIPYGTAESYVKIGDTVFTHGDIYPDSHAKPYALRYTPYKVVYGHLHHMQSYTAHRALLNESARYAITAGCMCSLNPAWKKGAANQWVNGFVSFFTDGKMTTPTVHLIENGKFAIGNKIYG